MKKERNYQPLLVILVLIVIGVFLWIALQDWQSKRAESARQQENREWQKQSEALTKKITDLETQLRTVQPEESAGESRAAEILGPIAADETGKEAPSRVEEIERQVVAFFTYLDNREYVKAFQLEGGAHAQYVRAVDDLSAGLPQVSGETESLYTTLKNVSHFYRVLGKNRTKLALEVLRNEAEILESVMRLFYAWATGPAGTLKGRPALPAMYEYASYFLDTLGGRSYLMRRDPKLRLLTTYYSILVMDRANDRKMNPNGIDIRPAIAVTAKEIRSHTGLAYRKQYLAELERLTAKYP
jgi:cell division protein FtsB